MTKGGKSSGGGGPSYNQHSAPSYGGKSANDSYHGARGTSMNPQASSSAKADASAQMASFSNSARDHSAGYQGTVQNPQSSHEAKSAAGQYASNIPKW